MGPDILIVDDESDIRELVAGTEHRDAVRQEKETTKVLNLLPAKCQNRRRHALVSFVSAVPTAILVHTVLVVMAVLPVMLPVVRNEVVQREAVMGVDVVHGLVGVVGVSAAVGK